jgi:rRNA maturation RNase YbeY
MLVPCFVCTTQKATVTAAQRCKCRISHKSAQIQQCLPHCLCRHSLQDECRILLLHGLLHLLGHDHELGDTEAESMAQQEQDIMQKLSWKVRICYAAVVFPCLSQLHVG